MITYRNQAGWEFVWPDHSDLIEVWHRDDPFDVPVVVISAEDIQRNEKAVKKLANETADFAKSPGW